ncbi:hypothetical protein BD311DRAFT_554180 [Dichomitus squalens]|uniref:Uncharacterized protein n=1 Tax=Dichomitus squalens TaxID=114155 RepID=A0A4Q9MDE0_9APHY|nr:hypothetical protein BD311DRAFT_554180 [Dichomitus squalens]
MAQMRENLFRGNSTRHHAAIFVLAFYGALDVSAVIERLVWAFRRLLCTCLRGSRHREAIGSQSSTRTFA